MLILLFTSGSQSQDYQPKTRRSFARAMQILGGLILVAVLVWFFKFSTVTNTAFFLFLLGIGLGIFLIYFGTRQLSIQYKIPQSLQFKQSEITQWLSRWEEINGEVTNVLAPSKEMSEPMQINSEVTAYSFDRVIVCDTAEIAQFLIANNFHFEHNCAVLSIDGYPENIFSTVMQMLKQNPDLKVYAFHSATPRGVTTINELRNSPNWFGGNNLIIYDLGLLPRHVFASKNMWILKSDVSAGRGRKIPTAVKSTLSTDELAWLEAGFYVELESFSPRKLLQVVSQGIAKTQAVTNGYTSASDNSLDSGDSSNDGIILIGIDDNNRNVGFFASDSFG
ncbi:MFS transporter permease [Okeania sp. KiyG1]|uniref:MFS transporter permease n=1 Tax=Okeania sp. KiyG1 TaxID=2720165 RepID=UPI001922AB06|nr:MFS transporter permease [Okeania sp. KiyG1]